MGKAKQNETTKTNKEQLLVEALCFKAARPESLSENGQNQRSVKLIEKQPCPLHKERAGYVSPCIGTLRRTISLLTTFGLICE